MEIAEIESRARAPRCIPARAFRQVLLALTDRNVDAIDATGSLFQSILLSRFPRRFVPHLFPGSINHLVHRTDYNFILHRLNHGRAGGALQRSVLLAPRPWKMSCVRFFSSNGEKTNWEVQVRRALLADG